MENSFYQKQGIAKAIRRNLVIFLFGIVIFIFCGCTMQVSNESEEGTVSDLEDPYEAYNLSREKSYDEGKNEDLFHADTNTNGNPTLYVDGVYVSDYGNHDIKNKSIYTEQIAVNSGYGYALGGPAEEFLCIPLFVDKGNATSSDGNIGLLYCRILKVGL